LVIGIFPILINQKNDIIMNVCKDAPSGASQQSK